MGGFPERLQKLVLKDREAITCRAGELLEDEDLEKISKYLDEKYNIDSDMKDVLSYALYPKVFEDYIKYKEEHGDLTRMKSDIFFHGLREGEIGEVEIEEGKILVIKLVEIGRLEDDGYRTLYFEVNDSRRSIKILDKASKVIDTSIAIQMADPDDKKDIGSSIPGNVAKVLVKVGDTVEENQLVAVIEAMKMETQITSSVKGKVKSVSIKEEDKIESGQLLMRLE